MLHLSRYSLEHNNKVLEAVHISNNKKDKFVKFTQCNILSAIHNIVENVKIGKILG